MKGINCCIVTDLLPLYREDSVSAETRSFVTEHLSHCESCKREFEKSSHNVVTADKEAGRSKGDDPLRSDKKRIHAKRALPVSAALILLIAMIFPLPIKIDQTVSGIYWESGGGPLEKECEVAVDGWYYRYLLKDNVFKGNILFSTADGTVSYDVPNAVLHRDAMYGDRGGSVTVYDAEQNRMRALGYIAVSGNFKEIFIHTEEGNISAPAGSRSDAMELAKELATGEWWY